MQIKCSLEEKLRQVAIPVKQKESLLIPTQNLPEGKFCLAMYWWNTGKVYLLKI